MSIDYDALHDAFVWNNYWRVNGPDGQCLVTNGIVLVAVPDDIAATWRASEVTAEMRESVLAIWDAAARDADRSAELMPVSVKSIGKHFDSVVFSINGAASFWLAQERFMEPFLQQPLPYFYRCTIGDRPAISIFSDDDATLVGVVMPVTLNEDTESPDHDLATLFMLGAISEWHRNRRDGSAVAA